MNDMLRLARADIEGARFYAANSSDEVYLNYAGYHCSQAAEKAIKFFIIEHGVIPPKVHRIYELINFIKNKGIYSNILFKMENIALELDSWLSETRYLVNHLASKDRVEFAISLLNDLIDRISPAKVEPVDCIKSEAKCNPPEDK